MNCEICGAITTWKICDTNERVEAYCSVHGHLAPRD